MRHDRFLTHKPRLARGTEDLQEMHGLPFVRHIEVLIGMVVLLTLHDRCQICRGIEIGAVRFLNEAGRDLFGVAFLRDLDHHCAFALLQQALLFELCEHGWDVGLRIAFALPKVKAHVQVAIVLL